jgi:hypothetical protein
MMEGTGAHSPVLALLASKGTSPDLKRDQSPLGRRLSASGCVKIGHWVVLTDIDLPQTFARASRSSWRKVANAADIPKSLRSTDVKVKQAAS